MSDANDLTAVELRAAEQADMTPGEYAAFKAGGTLVEITERLEATVTSQQAEHRRLVELAKQKLGGASS